MDPLRRKLLGLLNYDFRDPELFAQALTHRSVGTKNNERLEFLGDAVIELIVSKWLFEAVPNAAEGQLTRYRAAFVCRESLAKLARDLNLGSILVLGGGELKSGGRQRDSILADGFEALFGAMYLDSGLDACRQCLLPMLEPRLNEVSERNPKESQNQAPGIFAGAGDAHAALCRDCNPGCGA